MKRMIVCGFFLISFVCAEVEIQTESEKNKEDIEHDLLQEKKEKRDNEKRAIFESTDAFIVNGAKKACKETLTTCIQKLNDQCKEVSERITYAADLVKDPDLDHMICQHCLPFYGSKVALWEDVSNSIPEAPENIKAKYFVEIIIDHMKKKDFSQGDDGREEAVRRAVAIIKAGVNGVYSEDGWIDTRFDAHVAELEKDGIKKEWLFEELNKRAKFDGQVRGFLRGRKEKKGGGWFS
jgi:hypothetical protein